MDKGIDHTEHFSEQNEEVQKKSVELTQEVEKEKENLARMKAEVEQADFRVSEANETVKISVEAEAVAKKESTRVRDSLNSAISQSEETIKRANKAKIEAEQASKRYETLKMKAEKKSRDDNSIKTLEQSRRDHKEAQKRSIELTQEVEKETENLARIKAEVEQADLRVSEAIIVLKTSTQAEIVAKTEATQTRDRLKTAIRRSEDVIKLANKKKTELAQASKKYETLKKRVEKNPGDKKTVKALEQAGHDLEEVKKNSMELTQEVEKEKENLTRIKGEVEHADMQVTKAVSAVKTSAEAETAAKKKAMQSKDKLNIATRQNEETIKLSQKAKTELDQISKRFEILEEKIEKKSKDEKSIQALEQARSDFEETKRKSVELTQEVEKEKENLARIREELEQADQQVIEATEVVKTSTEAEITAKRDAKIARDRINTATRQSEKTIKLANKAKNEAEQASRKFETKKLKEEKQDTGIVDGEEKDQVIATINTEEDKVISNGIYQGKIKIRIDRPVTFNSIRELKRLLKQQTGLSVISVGGSVEEGACIFINVDQPSSLETLLTELPVIERLSTDRKNLHLTLKST